MAGASQTFTVTPSSGYSLIDLRVDGASAGALNSYTFENISGNHSIEAIFTYRVVVEGGSGGSITPSGVVVVKPGQTVKVKIKPNKGYKAASMEVDGVALVKPKKSYKFKKINADHSIRVTFASKK